QTDRPPFVVTFASHHVHHQLRNVTDPGQPVKIHIRIQHATGSRVHDFLFVQRGGNTHDQGAVTLAFSGFHVDDQPAILHADHFVQFDHAGLDVNRRVCHDGAAHTAAD